MGPYSIFARNTPAYDSSFITCYPGPRLYAYSLALYNSWMEYAISLLHYHRYDEAEPIIEACYRKYAEWGDERKIPFEYAKYYHKIALVRIYQGDFEDAIRLATRGADLVSQTGYELFETRLRFDLACIILQSGDVDKALQTHREIFHFRLENLGQLEVESARQYVV